MAEDENSDFVANPAEQKVIREPPQIRSPDMTLRIEKDSGLSSKNLGNWQAGFITTLWTSPFVVSLNASRSDRKDLL